MNKIIKVWLLSILVLIISLSSVNPLFAATKTDYAKIEAQLPWKFEKMSSESLKTFKAKIVIVKNKSRNADIIQFLNNVLELVSKEETKRLLKQINENKNKQKTSSWITVINDNGWTTTIIWTWTTNLDNYFESPNSSNNNSDEYIDYNKYLFDIKDKVKQFVWVKDDLKSLTDNLNQISYNKIMWINSSDDAKEHKNLVNSNVTKLKNEILLYNYNTKEYYVTIWWYTTENLKEKWLNDCLNWNGSQSYSNYFNLKLYDWTANTYINKFTQSSENNIITILNNITNNQTDLIKWIDILIYENQVNFEKDGYSIIKKDNSSDVDWFFTKLWNKSVVFVKSSATDNTYVHELLHAIHNKQNLNLWYLEEWLAFFSWNFTNDVVYNWKSINFTSYLWNNRIFYSENRVYKINSKIENKSNLNNYGESKYLLTWLYSKYWMDFIHELYSVAKSNTSYSEEKLIMTALSKFNTPYTNFDSLYSAFVKEIKDISVTEFN